MYQHRPSILHRPMRAEMSKATQESADQQHQKEQEYWRQKAMKSAETHDRLIRSIYPTGEDKLRAAEDWRQHMEVHMQAKMNERQQQEQKVKPWEAPNHNQAHIYVTHEDRPWLNPSMVYQTDSEERMARRRYEEEVSAANRRMADEAALARRMATEAEMAQARSSMAHEGSFWNVGAHGDRFAPPVARRVSRETHDTVGASPREPQHPPVYKWAAPEAALPARPHTAQPGGRVQQPPGGFSRTPFATDDDLPLSSSQRSIRPVQQQPQQYQQPQQQQQVSYAYGQPRPSTASRTPFATDADLPAPQQRPQTAQPYAPMQHPYATHGAAMYGQQHQPQGYGQHHVQQPQHQGYGQQYQSHSQAGYGQAQPQQQWAAKPTEREYPWSWKA